MARPFRSPGSRQQRAAAPTRGRGRRATATAPRPAGRQLPQGAAVRVSGPALAVRRVRQADIAHIIALDARVTGLAKPDYWQDIFERYGKRRLEERMFLVAELADAKDRIPLVGFIVGEVRAWEFGSEPCGWVFALSVDPRARLRGTGRALLEALCDEFSQAGVTKMRTMVARDNYLHHLFFRSEGMMAGPYIQLEKDLD